MDFIFITVLIAILLFSSKDDPHLKTIRFGIAAIAVITAASMFWFNTSLHAKLAKSSDSMYTLGMKTTVVDYSHKGFKYEPDSDSYFYTGSK